VLRPLFVWSNFLSTIALLMMWVPAYSACRAWHAPRGAPEPIYPFIFVAGGIDPLDLHYCYFLEAFCKPGVCTASMGRTSTCINRMVDGSLPYPTAHSGELYRFAQRRFLFFCVFVVLPLIIIVRQCGP
jgi:hypothetical protein